MRTVHWSNGWTGFSLMNPIGAASACPDWGGGLVQETSIHHRKSWEECILAKAAIVLLLFSLGVESFAADAPVPLVQAAPPRLVSEKIFEAVAEKVPRYVAPAPGDAAAEKMPEKPNDDGNGVLKLPKVTVRPRVVLPPVEGAFLTPKARLDRAMKANPGLRVGNLFGTNNGIASFMEMEERELKAKEALADTVQRTTSNDGAEAKEVRELLEKASQRINADWSGQSRP